jgi:V8-like Glu-specific endopeptidase
MSRKAKLPSAGAITLFLLSLTFSPSASAIINGQPDGNRHPYVGVVEFDVDGVDTLRCSGSLISPTIVITAAHCILYSGATSAKVSFDSEVNDNSVWIPATAFYTHPDFCFACGTGKPRLDTHDIAVVILSQKVENKGFAALPSIGFTDALADQTPVTVVGYGTVGISRQKPPHMFQFNSIRNYALSAIIKNSGVLTDEFIKLTQNPGDAKGSVCFGDSGGPAFLADTNIVLASITLATGRNCTGVQWSYRLDTQSAQDFIKSFL